MKTNSRFVFGGLRLASSVFVLFLFATASGAQTGNGSTESTANISPGGIRAATTTAAREELGINEKLKIRSWRVFVKNHAFSRAVRGKRSTASSPLSNPVVLGTTNADDFLVFKAGGIERAVISTDGKFGIGTTSPRARLDLYGAFYNRTGTNENIVWADDGSNASMGVYNDALDTFEPITFNASKFDFMYGNVGIGTTSPGAKLDLRASASTSNQALVVTSTGSLANNDIVRMQILGLTNGFRMFQDVSSNVIYSFEGGNVGIGTIAPGQKLDVVGNINVSGSGGGNITLTGTINAKYQDVAEWVPASEQLSVGTVVVLDSTKSNQVTSSSVSYDTRVAGVVSEQPGIALGEKSEGKVLVATTGRVRVKVDATKGPIHIGDLLVTSDVPGVAMKSEAVKLGGVEIHRPGTLIGKALEPLEKGKGEILVLLSLQ